MTIPPQGRLPSPEVGRFLAPDEHLVWEGQPVGSTFGASNLFGGVFGLVFVAFALFWMMSAFRMGAPAGFPAFGLIFVLAGGYMVVESLILSPMRRGSGRYAVTDRRLLFIVTFPRLRVKELPLTNALRQELNLNNDGTGTIEFMDPVSVHDPDGLAHRSSRYGRGTTYRAENHYTFHRIEHAVEVSRLIESAIHQRR